MSEKMGFAKAVTAAVKVSSDNWLLYMPTLDAKPGRFSKGRRAMSHRTEDAMCERTHDQLDAAIMRLCLDDDDAIRNGFLRGGT